MQKILPRYFPNLPRIAEITNVHCGPATLQMLFENIGVRVSQDEIVEAAGSSLKRLRRYGMSMGEMATAVGRISSSSQFWMKDNCEISDLKLLLERGIPVGVEWQGEFLQYSDEDNGHYSVVTHLDGDKIYIADPYEHFAGKDRRLELDRFEELWWDTNELRDMETGKMVLVRDHHMIFIIIPKDETFPEELGMIRA